MINIYTDGSCYARTMGTNNKGDGGWCALFEIEGNIEIISGFETNTTNNRMEMIAAIKAIEALPLGSNVKIYSDSQILINGMTGNSKRMKVWKDVCEARKKSPKYDMDCLKEKITILENSFKKSFKKAGPEKKINLEKKFIFQKEQLVNEFESKSGNFSKLAELANWDLWQKLEKIAHYHDIDWVWIKGHNGNKYNEVADHFASYAATNQKILELE
jgi:ribonuclease HI